MLTVSLQVPVFNVLKYVIISLIAQPLIEKSLINVFQAAASRRLLKGGKVRWQESRLGLILLHGKYYSPRTKVVLVITSIVYTMISIGGELGFDARQVNVKTERKAWKHIASDKEISPYRCTPEDTFGTPFTNLDDLGIKGDPNCSEKIHSINRERLNLAAFIQEAQLNTNLRKTLIGGGGKLENFNVSCSQEKNDKVRFIQDKVDFQTAELATPGGGSLEIDSETKVEATYYFYGNCSKDSKYLVGSSFIEYRDTGHSIRNFSNFGGNTWHTAGTDFCFAGVRVINLICYNVKDDGKNAYAARSRDGNLFVADLLAVSKGFPLSKQKLIEMIILYDAFPDIYSVHSMETVVGKWHRLRELVHTVGRTKGVPNELTETVQANTEKRIVSEINVYGFSYLVITIVLALFGVLTTLLLHCIASGRRLKKVVCTQEYLLDLIDSELNDEQGASPKQSARGVVLAKVGEGRYHVTTGHVSDVYDGGSIEV